MLHVKVKKNGVDRKLSVMNINSAMYDISNAHGYESICA